MNQGPLFAKVLALTHGTVMVEYVIVLSLVSVGASLAVIALGGMLLALFRYQQAILLLPVP